MIGIGIVSALTKIWKNLLQPLKTAQLDMFTTFAHGNHLITQPPKISISVHISYALKMKRLFLKSLLVGLDGLAYLPTLIKLLSLYILDDLSTLHMSINCRMCRNIEFTSATSATTAYPTYILWKTAIPNATIIYKNRYQVIHVEMVAWFRVRSSSSKL